MSAAATTLDATGGAAGDPHHVGHGGPGDASGAAGRGRGGPSEKRIVVGYGFWIFLLSDIVMFSAFFAAFAVLMDATAGGPPGRELFDLTNVAIETACLLLSSFTCGVAAIMLRAGRIALFQVAMAATFGLGTAFLALEVTEFAGLVARDAGPGRSAFLSAFFALVGLHGLHVAVGLLWLLTMMAQVFAKGDRPDIQRRVQCFVLFWHALDIVWVGVLTVVYLLGSGA